MVREKWDLGGDIQGPSVVSVSKSRTFHLEDERQRRRDRVKISPHPGLFPLPKSVVSAPRVTSIEIRRRHDESDVQCPNVADDISLYNYWTLKVKLTKERERERKKVVSFNRSRLLLPRADDIRATLYAWSSYVAWSIRQTSTNCNYPIIFVESRERRRTSLRRGLLE